MWEAGARGRTSSGQPYLRLPRKRGKSSHPSQINGIQKVGTIRARTAIPTRLRWCCHKARPNMAQPSQPLPSRLPLRQPELAATLYTLISRGFQLPYRTSFISRKPSVLQHPRTCLPLIGPLQQLTYSGETIHPAPPSRTSLNNLKHIYEGGDNYSTNHIPEPTFWKGDSAHSPISKEINGSGEGVEIHVLSTAETQTR